MIRLILGEESSTNVPNKVDFSDREYITKVAEELVSVCKRGVRGGGSEQGRRSHNYLRLW